MQRNRGVSLLMVVGGHRLSQGVWLIDLNCGTFHDLPLFLRSFVFLQYGIAKNCHVIAVKYDALLIVRFHHPCNILDKGILEIDYDLHTWTFSYITGLGPYCQ